MKKSGLILILGTAVIILIASIARFADIFMPAASQRLFLIEGWQYRWGSSPVDAAGNPVWASELSGEGWQPMAFAGEPPGRNGQDTLWLKVEVPPGRYDNPALFAKFVRQNFILYSNRQPVYKYGELPSPSGERYQPWLPAHFILLPQDFDGGPLVFQISSAHPGMGIYSPVEFAPYRQLMHNKLSDDLFKIITGTVMLFAGLAAMILYLRSRRSPYLFFGGYVLMVSLVSFSSTFAKDYFWEAPTFWMNMIVFSAGGLQVFWFGFLHAIVEADRLAVVRQIFRLLLVLLGLTNVLFWYNPAYLSLIMGIIGLTALISYAVMWWALLPRLRHDLITQIFAMGSTLWIYAYLGDAVVLQFFPNIHHTYMPYGHFADALAMLAILIIQFNRINQKVKALTEELILADKRKDEFLAKTSHEIKTPLHGIINMTKLFLEQQERHLDPIQRQNLTLVINTADRLSRLVNDILDLAKNKEGTLVIQPEVMSVTRHLQDVFDICRFVHQGTTNLLQIDAPPDLPCIRADRDRFRQIVSNLLDNAIMYTRSGTVTLTARCTSDHLAISVADTGPGIDSADRDIIFEPFAQLSHEGILTTSRAGLGLSIVKELTELQGGTVTLDSVPGQGSCFTVTFPIAKGQPWADADRSAAASDETPQEPVPSYSFATPHVANPDEKTTLIIADDTYSNLKVLIDAFADEPYRIIAVTNGHDVLDQIRTVKQVDLVILDIMMPDMSGYEVCRIIREQYNLAELPVLMLTAATHIADAGVALKMGANDYLHKPFLLEELRARVNSLILLKQAAGLSAAYEIAFLHAQIKPHFLYNALNTIAEYCETDSPAAGRLILSLAKYLRSSLDFANLANLVSADKELTVVKAYLNIEKARFESLVVEWDIDMDAMGKVYLPPLTLQTLVENAVKHGVLRKKQSGTVRISIKRHPEGIQFTVKDDGPGISHQQFEESLTIPSGQEHIGLYNINRRLIRIYGSGLSCTSEPGVGTAISFIVPVEV